MLGGDLVDLGVSFPLSVKQRAQRAKGEGAAYVVASGILQETSRRPTVAGYPVVQMQGVGD